MWHPLPRVGASRVGSRCIPLSHEVVSSPHDGGRSPPASSSPDSARLDFLALDAPVHASDRGGRALEPRYRRRGNAEAVPQTLDAFFVCDVGGAVIGGGRRRARASTPASFAAALVSSLPGRPWGGVGSDARPDRTNPRHPAGPPRGHDGVEEHGSADRMVSSRSKRMESDQGRGYSNINTLNECNGSSRRGLGRM